MKRNSIFTFLFALVALLSACSVLASPVAKRAPPPPPSTLFKVDRPSEGTTYSVGEQVYVHTENEGGSKGEIYKKNPDVKLSLQTKLPMPDINKVVVKVVKYQTLANHGIYFTVKDEYLSKNPNLKYRVRASFYDNGKQRYVDSAGFNLARN
ncbi:hypothetical protein DFQ26_000092 [Actinomortierella ambigua]|nr:hypothetical protein DFQ26_000092 [Actinomortierella ambigua]